MAIRDMVPFQRRGTRAPARSRRDITPIDRLHDEVDRLFEGFFSGLPDIRGREEEGWPIMPEIDVRETDKEIQVTAELPGVEEKDLDLRIDEAGLTISGEKREEDESKEGNYYRTERRYGSFTRTIPLTAEVDADNTEADFKNGVLHVRLPKLAESEEKGKKIEVKGGK